MRSLVLLAGTLVLASCADGNPSSMVVLGHRLPDMACTVNANEGGGFNPLHFDLSETLPDGTVNLGLKAHAVVKNLITDDDGMDDDIQIEYADVEIVAANTQPSIDLVNQLIAAQQHRHSPLVEGGYVPEGGTGVGSFDLLSDPMRQVLAANFPGGQSTVQIQARVTLHGSLGVGDIQSRQWVTPITLFPATGLVDDLGDCCTIAEDGEDTCEPFQTGISCCSTSGTTYCPAFKPESCM